MRRWKIVLPLVIVGLILTACPPKQIPQIAEAQSAIDAAIAAGAERYAPTKLRAAQEALAAAETARKNRKYKEAVAQAELAKKLANEARMDALEAARREQEAQPQPPPPAQPAPQPEEHAEAAGKACEGAYKVVYFDFDKYNIKDEFRADLDAAVSCLKNNPHETVTITGYCDPRGTDEYNMALGERRANSVKTYLVNSGIDASRITIISKGESALLDPSCESEDCWWKERRAVLE